MARAAALAVGALWILWGMIWVAAALRTKPVARRESPLSRAAHGAPIVLAALLLFLPRSGWVVARIVPPSAALALAGTAGVLAGIGLALWARLHLAGDWSGTVTLKHHHALVRTGPYRWVRHPIYTGLLLALLGTTVEVDRWSMLGAMLLVAVAFLRKIRVEERFLRDAFDADHARYCRSTPALIPFLV